MDSSLKFAAIDIGSNAMRLLLAGVFENQGKVAFKKISLTRMPIRLGEDAFTKKKISKKKADQLINAMKGYKCLIDSYRPIAFRGCATSAMREAVNGVDLCRQIKEEVGLDIEIINGRREAEIIFENKSAENLTGSNAYLYIDVGGGSTEVSLFSKGEKVASESFNLGTIRLANDIVSENTWKDAKSWIKKITKPYENISAIGTGGNINKLSRMAHVKKGKPLTYQKLKKVQKDLKEYNYYERIVDLGLRPDRADVIIPASKIYLSLMKWGKIESIHVPIVGLADGLVRLMYQDKIAAGKNKGQKTINLV